MNNNVTGIGHSAFNTSKMNEMLRFYCDILGFEHSFGICDANGEPWIEYIRVAGSQFLELFYTKEPFTAKEGTYAHLCLQVADLMAMDKLLKDNNIPVFWGPKKGGDNNWQCWVNDPDGNFIEFMQLDPESPQALAARGTTSK